MSDYKLIKIKRIDFKCTETIEIFLGNIELKNGYELD